MSTVEYESMNVVAPLKNSGAMKCVANIAVAGAVVVQDLEALFGSSIWDGHYLTIAADGPKVYVAFGSASGSIDPTAVGVSTLACWPIPAESRYDYRLVAGREGALGPSGAQLGAATQVRYNFLHVVGASAGSATGYVRLYRSSLAPGQNPGEQFKATS